MTLDKKDQWSVFLLTYNGKQVEMDMVDFKSFSEFVEKLIKIKFIHSEEEFFEIDFDPVFGENSPLWFFIAEKERKMGDLFVSIGFESEEKFEHCLEVCQYCQDENQDYRAVKAYLDYFEEFDKESFEERIMGEYETKEDFIWDQIDEGVFGSVPDLIKNYINIDAMVRDDFPHTYVYQNGFVFYA